MAKFFELCRNVAFGATLLTCGALPAHAAEAFGEGADIYGYLSSPAGMYTVTADNYELLWEDTGYRSRFFVPMTSGWLVDGKMCGYANDGYDAFYVEYDWATGEILKSESLSASNCPVIAVLNEADGKVYGFSAKGDSCKFFVSEKDNASALTEVATLAKDQMCLGLTYNTDEGYVAGMRYDGALVKLTADGSEEVLLNTYYTVPSSISYTAFTYCASDRLYYWNPTNVDYESQMYVIDPSMPSVASVSTFPDKQFRFMLSAGEALDSNAPKAPEIKSAEFIDGSADGKIVVTMPTELESGETISGDVAWTASIDGETVKEGQAAAGADVTVEFEGISTGNHTFAFSAAIGDHTGKTASTMLYVGFDTPKSPANVVLTDNSVRWEAVTEGVNGGYVNSEAIVYTIYLNDEKIGTTTATEYQLDNLEQGELRRVTASVTATANEMTSAPGVSNGLTVGTLSLPAFFQPTTDDFAMCQVIDGDGNGRCWTYDANNEAFYGSYNLDRQVDDWLILPAVTLDGSSSCTITMQARRMRSFFADEAIEVKAAMEPTAEALADGLTLIEETQLPSAYEELTGRFTPTEAGKWYIALHAVSDADQAGMYVKEILIAEDGVTMDSPAAVTALTAEAAEGAKLEATVSFTLPVKTLGGADIDSEAQVEATVTGASTATVSGTPGERVSAVVETVQGLNRIAVETAIGELHGLKAYVEVYTGYDIPGSVNDLSAAISADMKSAEITWSAPTEGADGGVIDPAAITYNVYRQMSSSLGNYWELLEENVEATSYTFTPTETAQDVYVIGVAAANVAGVNPEPEEVVAVLGTPYTLPMVETFDNPHTYYTYNYWVTYTPTDDYATQWGVLPMESLPFFDTTEWNVVLCGMGLREGALGRCGFPVFSTKGETEVTITAPFWTGEMSTPDVRIIGLAYGMTEPVEVGAVTQNGGWNTVEFALPAELLDQEWVSLFLEASFPEGSSQWVCMDGYTIDRTVSVSNVAADGVEVKTHSGAIEILGAAGQAYAVYTFDGRTIAQGVTAADTTRVALAPGMYLVRIADTTLRIAVK